MKRRSAQWPGDGTKPLTVINNGIFLDYVQAWVAASFENSFTTPEVVINGGEFHKKFWMRPTFVDKNDKDLTGYHVAVKLNGGTIHETLSVDKQPSDYGYAPVRPRLSYSDVTFLAAEMLGKNRPFRPARALLRHKTPAATANTFPITITTKVSDGQRALYLRLRQ